MPKYRYEAVNDEGHKVESTMAASDFKEVVAKILMSRYYPTRIEELSEHSSVHYQRLDRFKQIRKIFDKEEPPSSIPMPTPSPTKQRKTGYLVIVAILVWLAMLVVYLVSQAQL